MTPWWGGGEAWWIGRYTGADWLMDKSFLLLFCKKEGACLGLLQAAFARFVGQSDMSIQMAWATGWGVSVFVGGVGVVGARGVAEGASLFRPTK